MTVFLMVAVCLGTGFVIRVLRRLPRLVFAASLIGAGLLAVLLANAPFDPVYIFGRTLTLDPSARLFLIPALVMATALALFAPLTFERVSDEPAQAIPASQGAYFFWGLAPLIVAIALDSFPLAVFFWAVGLIVLMLAAQSRGEGRVGGAAQFLLLTVIASACLLLANRLIDLYPLTPENLDLIRNTAMLLALGFGLLLAVVPFNLWLGPLADEMPLLSVAFLVGVAQPIGLWLIFQRMDAVPWLVTKSPMLQILLYGGILTVPIGALLALGERRSARWLAWLSLISLGNALIGLGLGTKLGLSGAVLAMFNRAVGVTLIAGGTSLVRHHLERRWQIVGACAVGVGGFALAGIPPMFGFAERFSIYHNLIASNSGAVVVLLAANALALLATIREVWFLIKNYPAPAPSSEFKIVPYLGLAILVILFGFALVVGLFPQLLGDWLLFALGNAAYLK